MTGTSKPDQPFGQPAYIVSWWCEAEAAIQSGHTARARRFLRWILVAYPHDDDAWLELAKLAPGLEEQLVYLHRAQLFCPKSAAVQAALRATYARHLQECCGPLDAGRRVARCLPYRQSPPPGNGRLPRSWQVGRMVGKLSQLATAARRRRPPPGGDRPGSPGRPNGDGSRRTSGVSRARPDVAAWLSFLLPLVAYVLTLCPTVYNLDSAEFSAAAYTLGLVRATGYPLYLLLGKLFTLLPVGDVAFRLNLMSAVCAAGTAALVYQLIRRLTGQRAAALAGSLLLAFSYYFWAQAVIAEVYALHTLLLAALLLVLFQWEATRAVRWLAVLGLLYGLSFGNHMSSILLAPAFAAFLARREVLRPRPVLVLALAFVAGLAVYLYLPLRYLAHPVFNYVGQYTAAGEFAALDLTRPANIWWLISGQGFRHLMFDYTAPELARELGQSLWRLWGSFLGIGLVPGLLGAWVQGREKPRHLLLFGLALLANLVFFTGYRIVDKETEFLPVYLIWSVWVGIGYAWLVRWVQGRRPAAYPGRPRWAWALAALAAVALVVNWQRVDLHGDTRAYDRATASLVAARPGAIIFGWWTSVPAMHYLQLVEGQRPDVLVINRFLIGADEMYRLIDRSLDRRPVYVVELDEGLIGTYQPVPAGPLFELAPHRSVSRGP